MLSASWSHVLPLWKSKICVPGIVKGQRLLSREVWTDKPKEVLWRKWLRWYLDTFPSSSTTLPSLKSELFLGKIIGKFKSVILGLRIPKVVTYLMADAFSWSSPWERSELGFCLWNHVEFVSLFSLSISCFTEWDDLAYSNIKDAWEG